MNLGKVTLTYTSAAYHIALM